MVWPLLGGAVALAVACGSTVAAAPQVSVRVDATETISQTDPGYKCWNIDGSAIRQWDTRDLSSPLLASLGRQSLPGYLRFGGSGNNNLRYALDMSDESSAGNRCAALSGSERCLNRTWVDHLANFAQRSGAKLVFGLNMAVCDSSEGSGNCFGEPWAAGEAKILMEYLIQANHSVFGFELGNEMDEHYTASQTAANFRALSDLLTQLWPQTGSRPKLIGPDVHGFHSDPLTSTADGRKLEFLVDFVRNCSRLHVPLHAATHHEYVDVDPYPATPPNASQLQVTNEVGSAVNDSLALAAPSVQIWAGEIGPHNGGKEGHKPAACGTDHRWANFADSQWYLDAMGVKAANGYKAFCRQDFVGAHPT
jgi:heparanase 1